MDIKGTGVYIVTGKQGAGKTYYAVDCIVNALLSGRLVYTNIELKWAAITKHCYALGVTVPRGNYRTLQSGPNWHRNLAEGAIAVYDETQLDYNNRDYKQTDREQRELLEFFPQARKNGVLIVLITQDEHNIDVQFLRQASRYFRIKDLLSFPVIKAFFPIPLTLVFECAADGTTINDRYYIWRKKCFAFYDTRQKYKAFRLDGAPAEEVIGKKRSNPYSSILLLLSIASAAYGYHLSKKTVPQADTVISPVAKPSPKLAEPIKPIEEPSIELTNEDKLPTVKSHFGRFHTKVKVTFRPEKGDTDPHYMRDSYIELDTGRTLRKGDWLQGIILSWVWIAPSVCRVKVINPDTNKITTLTLYDSTLNGIERNRTSNFIRPNALGDLPSVEGGNKEPQKDSVSLVPETGLLQKAKDLLK